MLKVIGVASVDALMEQIPQRLRNPHYNFPRALTEMELARHLKELASKNIKPVNFAGGGAYEHFIPSAVRSIISRGEFLSAYTPYQAEASQGTLQAIYEFQSLICSLFEMDCSNASMYDGATALAEAVNAALKITSRKKVLLSRALNPEWRKVLDTYFKTKTGCVFEDIPCPEGVIDIDYLRRSAGPDTACVVAPSPNFFGCIEDMEAVSAAAKAKGGLLIAVPDPLSLGLLRTPGSFGADFAVAEGQGLGNPLNYGGPYLGIFTCRKEYLRSMPGRVAGITKDAGGKRAFVLTLQAREQHIRREKASSNICSNEALCALSAAVYLTLLGPEGVKEAAELNYSMGHLCAERLSAMTGFSLKYNAPFYNEFALKCPSDAQFLADGCLKEGVLAGVPLGKLFTGMDDCLLVCATETKTAEDITKLESALRKAAGRRGHQSPAAQVTIQTKETSRASGDSVAG